VAATLAACWGVTLGEAGVIVCAEADRIWWAVVSVGAPSILRASRWGRLLQVRGTGDPTNLRIAFGRPIVPSQRTHSLRLETVAVEGAGWIPLAPGIAWTYGNLVPADAWVDARTVTGGPAYVSLHDLADGVPSIPLVVQLPDNHPLDGLVVGRADYGAAGALVTIFRLIDPRPPGGASGTPPRRVLIVEKTADALGAFHVDGLGDADYEIVAWHPQLGRASVAPPRQPGNFVIRLESPGTARGRVLTAGTPQPGVDVVSMPDPEAFGRAHDAIDVKGGDTRTGADGRFTVMLAAAGGGELRVGGGSFPIRRIPLPRGSPPLVDLGDIDLGSPMEISIVLDQDSACAVQATGPVGQTGLQIVAGAHTGPGLFRMVVPEPGLWAFGLLCGREERPLSPALVQIGPANAGKEVRFSIRHPPAM
jgi:hypothetical protein